MTNWNGQKIERQRFFGEVFQVQSRRWGSSRDLTSEDCQWQTESPTCHSCYTCSNWSGLDRHCGRGHRNRVLQQDLVVRSRGWNTIRVDA